jgi:hypothetical protein
MIGLGRARDYPLLFMSRGHVIFASRSARAPSFSEILDVWASRGIVCSPDPDVGGWGKFVRTQLSKAVRARGPEPSLTVSPSVRKRGSSI